MRTAEVKIAIFETRRFVRQILRTRDLKLKRRHFCIVQDQDFARVNLNVAGREFWVVGALTLDNGPDNSDDKLTTQALCFRVRVTRIFLVQNDLCNTVTIAQINKCENAKITLLRHPTHQHDLLSYMRFTQFTASVRPLQIS